MTGCIFLFTGRWAHNWGAYKRGGGGYIGGNLQYPSHLPIKVSQNISGLLSFFCAV